jgi:hypothetical protein
MKRSTASPLPAIPRADRRRARLLGRVLAEFTAEERYLADQRALGREWADLAAELGGTAEAARKKLARAIDRVGQGLGLEDDDV